MIKELIEKKRILKNGKYFVRLKYHLENGKNKIEYKPWFVKRKVKTEGITEVKRIIKNHQYYLRVKRDNRYYYYKWGFDYYLKKDVVKEQEKVKRINTKEKGYKLVTARLYAVRPYIPKLSGGESHTESKSLEIVAYFIVPNYVDFVQEYSLGIKIIMAWLHKVKYNFLTDIFMNGQERELKGVRFIHGATTSVGPSGHVYKTEIWNLKYGVDDEPLSKNSEYLKRGFLLMLRILDTTELKKELHHKVIMLPSAVTIKNIKEVIKRIVL